MINAVRHCLASAFNARAVLSDSAGPDEGGASITSGITLDNRAL